MEIKKELTSVAISKTDADCLNNNNNSSSNNTNPAHSSPASASHQRESKGRMTGDRKIAQRDVDAVFKNSGIRAIGSKKFEMKQELTARGITDFHARGREMKIVSWGTDSQIRGVAGRFYSFCREKYGISSINDLSYKFITPYLDSCKDRGNTASYIKKTIIPALTKVNTIVNQSSGKDFDYYKKCQKWLDKNAADCKKSEIVNQKFKGWDDPVGLIAAIKDDKSRIVAKLQYDYGFRSGDLLNINKFFDKDFKFLNNSKEGQKFLSVLTKTEFDQLKSFCNERGGFRLNYNTYRKEILAAARATGQRVEKGMLTHSFRYSFVQKKFVELLQKGYSTQQAHDILTESLFHHRADADAPYLSQILTDLS